MADQTQQQQPLSLNQRLVLLSASHSKHAKPNPSFSVRRPFEDDNVIPPNFDDIIDFDSPSPPPAEAAKGQVYIEDEPNFNFGDSPTDNSLVNSTDHQSLHLEEVNSETSNSKLAAELSGNNTASPISTLADLGSSSPSLDGPDDDHFDENPDFSTASKDDITSTGKLASRDTVSPLAAAKASVTEKDNNPPCFSVAHSDSSPAVEMEPSEVHLESNGHQGKNKDDSLRNPGFSCASHFNSSIQGCDDKQKKVKIAGRRRLCKISVEDAEDNSEGKNEIEDDEPDFLGVENLNSLPLVKRAVEDGGCGGNEIRDILNDLSSRLEILSIEKKRPPKKTDMFKNWENEVGSGVQIMKRGDEVPANESAVSISSFSSESFPISTKSTRVGVAALNTNVRDSDLQTKFKDDGLSGRDSKSKKMKNRLKGSEVKREGQKYAFLERFSDVRAPKQVEDEDDDCVIVSNKSVFKRNGKPKQNTGESKVLEDCGEAIILESKDTFTLSDPKSSYRLPAKIAKMLYPHQRDGLKWLWSLHCQGKGGILGDDMGLGKTMQICGFLAGLYQSNLIKRAMIVAPKTLLPHWIKELSTVGLSHVTREYFGTCAKARQYELEHVLQDKGILLTTYDIVRNNTKSLSGDHYYNDESSEDDCKWDYMILDEGHLIKNPGTQRAKSLLQIPCAHRIIISGTPVQNNLKELWALFNFSCPELLGDKKWFKEKYENPILRGNNKDASDREKRISSTVAKELRDRIQPYFLRRMKSEVCLGDDVAGDNKLSKKSEIIVWLRLTSCQRHIYEAFLKSEIVLSACDGSPLAALTILKKICDHPLLLTKRAAEDVLEGMDGISNQEDHQAAENLAMHIADVAERFDITEKHDVSCKLVFILSLLDNLIPEGHNVLIFSQTRKMLNLIQEALSSCGYEFMRIDGTTKASDRLKTVNDFQEGNGAPIFLLTSQVGGLGLTLTNADRVIVVDPAWNPSTDNQSVDRAYRIGQKKDVIVYRLMTCGTVEEKIYRKQVFKGGLFRTATEHKEQMRYFSQQDLRDIFRLPEHGFDISLTQCQLQEEHGQQYIMEESLNTHIEFLETLGIAGVSHHSLLFSKTTSVPVYPEEEQTRISRTTFIANASSSSSHERNTDGAAYAFNPKDVRLQQKTTSPTTKEPSEAEILERINRLSQIFANKATVARLPDKGQRIQNQISELEKELDKIRMKKRAGTTEIIELEDISGEFQRVLRV